MHPVAIHRTFATRAKSAIGEATIGECRLTGEARLLLDGKELPAKSIEYLMTFALQSLQDAYAGAETTDTAKAAWAAKRDKLLSGDIGARGPAASVSIEVRIARDIMRDIFHKKASDAARKAYKAADTDGRNAILDAAIAKNADVVAKLVAEEIKRRTTVGATDVEL